MLSGRNIVYACILLLNVYVHIHAWCFIGKSALIGGAWSVFVKDSINSLASCWNSRQKTGGIDNNCSSKLRSTEGGH